MIVRTYGRRKLGRTMSDLSFNDDVSMSDDFDEDPFTFRETTSTTAATTTTTSYSQQQFQESPQEFGSFTFSSQDSTRWANSSSQNDSDTASLQLLAPAKGGRRKKARRLNDGRRESEVSRRPMLSSMTKTTSLMETQECGEMMECVDEVDFALDGLRRGQGVRVRRASLLSLLNVCGSPHQRRLLKAQGMAKTIIDSLLDLSLDDSPSNLAAATLFYILTSDAQDSYLLDSFPSIRFLLKLLKPTVAEAAPEKASSISQKLLVLRKDMLLSRDMTKKADSSSNTLIQKVTETLVSCKDLKANVDNDGISRPELNSNWISLLTMEKACMSTISIEDTSGTVRKTGGNFKEKLRELGGLYAVFELALDFYSTLEGSIEHVTASIKKMKDSKLQSLPLLLKCLKIMENATVLSKENQSHLLGLKGNLAAGQGSSLSFVKLIISFIKILSELSLLRTSSTNSSPELPTNHSNGSDHYHDFLLNSVDKVNSSGCSSLRSSQECSSSGRYSSDPSLSTSQSSQRLSSFHSLPIPSNYGASTGFGVGNCLIEKAASSYRSASCSVASESSKVGALSNGDSSKTKLARKSPYDNDDMFIDLEDSQDPFAFDEEDLAPSKWEKLRGRHRAHHKQKRRPAFRDTDDECFSLLMSSQEDLPSQPKFSQEGFGSGYQNEVILVSSDSSCTTAIGEENSSLVADCLLTAIKVLMNLTNDNAVGCQQIAACGGLETLSSLIARHFPSLSLFISGENKEKTMFSGRILELESQTDLHLKDQELDFLVTILGLLVNMVENNGDNRSRLAATEVYLHCSGRLPEVHTGVIPLLCSIFLANRGAGEAAEELQSLDAEEVVLQGEKEAEKMIVEAYAALLLAFLSTESKSIRNAIANFLPNGSLKVLVPVLERFVTFHLALNMISPETHKTVSEVIESCRLP